FIHFLSAGTNHITSHPIYTSSKITLTTSSGIHGPMIAEWVIMTSLVSSHQYNALHTGQMNHKWLPKDDLFQKRHDNVGRRLGVLGYGSIGRQSARVCKAMGMDVIAFTASPRKTKESKKDGGFIVEGTGDPDGDIPSAWFSGLDKESLHEFLAQDIDHLLVSVPLTDQTRGFLGKEEFDVLSRKKKAFVTNISRGPIIRQTELIKALKKGAEVKTEEDEASDVTKGEGLGLRGAALDVTDPEPLPEDDPLWDAPNCIITPHISALGQIYLERSFAVLEVNLTHKEKGEKLINVVDRKRGY
ncbi:hypothetical protein MMC25_000215, partial [Agyrium rufum]|nr:hypothetical protein [Agyrium rufum]